MSRYLWLAVPIALIAIAGPTAEQRVVGCCPSPPLGKLVVNADQSVILLWDAATRTEHFIRRASFKGDAADFGFMIPSPSKPELAESGNEAFPTLEKLTEPEVKFARLPRGGGCGGCGCDEYKSTAPGAKNQLSTPDSVRVLAEKDVAGFRAAVLEATSAAALTDWLSKNGYAYSPQIEEWARPYIAQKWKITALKVAKREAGPDVSASALRLSFQTDRPLFPYREPDAASAAKSLGVNSRLLRIYFLADARFKGELTADQPWTGKAAWAGKVRPEDRTRVLGLLGLPATSGPAEWYLTEFEDPWPYRAAPADVYFARDDNQADVRREPITQYIAANSRPDGTFFVLACAFVLVPLLNRVRRWWS